MGAAREWIVRLWNTLRPRRADSELEDELRLHLELTAEASQRRGESPEAAARSARLHAGSVVQTMEAVRDQRGLPWVDNLGRDVRQSVRAIRRFPFVTTVAVISLALGIGANAAVLSLINQWLLRPLPVSEPDGLINLSAPGPKPGSRSCNIAGDCESTFSYPMFRDLELAAPEVLSPIAAHRAFDANLADRGQTAKAMGTLVSGHYFAVLGLQPAIGRLIAPEDDRVIDQSPVVVLSHDYWQSHYSGRVDVIGQTIGVNAQPMTIVGVAPRGFDGTTLGWKPQVFIPLTMRWALQPARSRDHDNRRSYWVYLFTRVKPGASIEQAAAAINVPYHAIINEVEAPLQRGMSDQTLARFKARRIQVDPGRRGQTDLAVGAPLTLLFATTALVLLIACVNVANLLLARAAARSTEMATRLSIGASRGHLISQLMVESSILALLGAFASIVVARWTMSLVRSLVPVGTVTMPLELDGSAFVAIGVLAVATTMVVGLLPALRATRSHVFPTLNGQSAHAVGGRTTARVRWSLVTAQVALSMVLMVLAGLFTKSLDNVTRVDTGVAVDGLVTFEISPERNAYSAAQTSLLIERIEDQLGALPGAIAVASAQASLLSGSGYWDSVYVEGFDVGPDTNNDTNYDEIGPEYFRTLGIPLIAGREFTRADSANSASVAIVNERFAARFNLGRDAVGKRMARAREGAPLDVEIVGVVKDARHIDVKETMPSMFFIPHRQNANLRSMTFYVRTMVPPDDMMAAIRRAMFRLDPNLPVEKLRTVQQQLRDETMVLDRFMSVLTGAFAGLATLLAAIGLYGVLAFTVVQRTKEIGLRMALGASPGAVRRMVLHQVALMSLIGGTVGAACGLAVARAAQTLLFGLQFHDSRVLTSAAIVLTVVAFAAGALPANRAARVDPLRALKYE
jgi:predicted permease